MDKEDVDGDDLEGDSIENAFVFDDGYRDRGDAFDLKSVYSVP